METIQYPAGFMAVESSQILAVGYFELASGKPFLNSIDDLNKAVKTERFGRLELIFMGGTRWAYASVPASLVSQLLTAESIGKFFNAEIKTNPAAYPPMKLPAFVADAKGD